MEETIRWCVSIYKPIVRHAGPRVINPQSIGLYMEMYHKPSDS